MAYTTELAVKQALGIDSWRNLSKEKVLRFAALMPEIDQEVTLAIVAQLPVFTKFALQALTVLERLQLASLSSNGESQAHVHSAFQEYRAVLKGELDREDMSKEDRQLVLDKFKEAVELEGEKDTENKRFIDGLVNKAALGAGGAMVAALIFVGAKVGVERSGGDESEQTST